MLENVIERKEKYEKAKIKHLFYLWVSIFYGFAFSYISYTFILSPHDYSFYAMFSAFFTSGPMLLSFLVAVFLFGASKIHFDKKEKTEKEYQTLRCEIIDRSKDLWKDQAWKQRHIIFEFMKKEFDINLYHQSK